MRSSTLTYENIHNHEKHDNSHQTRMQGPMRRENPNRLLHLEHVPHRQTKQKNKHRGKQLLDAARNGHAAGHVGDRIAPIPFHNRMPYARCLRCCRAG
jgi:hypothetical protein